MRRLAPIAVVTLIAAGAACDDQIKYVPTFSTMTEQPSIEAYERAALTPPAGCNQHKRKPLKHRVIRRAFNLRSIGEASFFSVF